MNIKKKHQKTIMRRNANTQEKRFDHFTLNTGHNLYQTKVPESLARLRVLAQMALCPGGGPIMDNITFEADACDDGYAMTVFFNIGWKKIPLLTTCGARTEELGQALWEELQKIFRGLTL